MKKILILFLLSVYIFIFTGCSNKLNEDSPLTAEVDGIQAYESFLSFEDLVHNSNVAIVGEYVETIEFDSYTEKKFKVKECLYGDVGDSEIYLYSNIGMGYIEEINYTYELGADIYKTGTDYILVMEKLQSVMYDHDRYMLSTDVFLCEETNEYILYSQPIDFPDDMPIKEYIISLHQINDSVNADNSDNSYQCDLEKMLNESSFVGQVMVQELVNEGKTHNGNTYRCIVKSLYKGDSLNTYADGTILVVILKNTVELNNTYVIGFSPVSENSLIYSQATDFSVYDVDEEFIKEINAYLNTADLNPIVNIVDRTKTEGLSYDTAEEKFFEDGDNEYFFSGIYSNYVIVHYEDGSQEDIVTALNAGRATIADLDKFEVDYIVRALDTKNQ